MSETDKTTNIDFDIQQNISLKSIVGNKHAVEMAANYIGDYYNNKEVPFLKPILLVSRNSCKTMAAAISNSFGNEGGNFNYVCGSFFSSGILELNNYFSYGNYCSTYYISNIEKLNSLNQYKLGRIFYECRINYIDRNTKLPISRPLFKHLHILSCKNIREINKPLLDQMGIIINLSALNESEILQVLQQRIKLMNLTVSPENVLIKIAQRCCSASVQKAIELLSLSLCLMRAGDESILTQKHIDRALFLDEKNTEAFLKNELT